VYLPSSDDYMFIFPNFETTYMCYSQVAGWFPECDYTEDLILVCCCGVSRALKTASKVTWQAVKWARPQISPIKTMQLCFAQNFGHAVASNLTTHFLVALALHIYPFSLLPGSPEAALCSSTCIQQERHHKAGKIFMIQKMGEDRVVLKKNYRTWRGNGRRFVGCPWRGRTALSRHTGKLDNSVPILIHCGH